MDCDTSWWEHRVAVLGCDWSGDVSVSAVEEIVFGYSGEGKPGDQGSKAPATREVFEDIRSAWQDESNPQGTPPRDEVCKMYARSSNRSGNNKRHTSGLTGKAPFKLGQKRSIAKHKLLRHICDGTTERESGTLKCKIVLDGKEGGCLGRGAKSANALGTGICRQAKEEEMNPKTPYNFRALGKAVRRFEPHDASNVEEAARK